MTVMLSGADFAIQNGLGNQFFGNIVNGYVSFSLRNTGGDYYYTINTVGRPDVVEHVSSGHLWRFGDTCERSLRLAGLTADSGVGWSSSMPHRADRRRNP